MYCQLDSLLPVVVSFSANLNNNAKKLVQGLASFREVIFGKLQVEVGGTLEAKWNDKESIVIKLWLINTKDNRDHCPCFLD